MRNEECRPSTLIREESLGEGGGEFLIPHS
jgi:hypothetical protein